MKLRLFNLTLIALLMLVATFVLTPQAANAAPSTCNSPGGNYSRTTYSSTPGTYQVETRVYEGLVYYNDSFVIKYYYKYKYTRKQYVGYTLRWQSVFYTEVYCGQEPANNPVDCTEPIGDTVDTNDEC